MSDQDTREMVNSPESTTGTLPPQSENEWPFPKGRDWLLAKLVWFAGMGWEQDITLSVDGGIITGQLISAHRYLGEMAKAAEAGRVTSQHADAHVITETFAKFYRDWQSLISDPAETKRAAEAPPPHYVHLINAQWLLSGERIPSAPTLLWRGRLTSVSSFSLGRIS